MQYQQSSKVMTIAAPRDFTAKWLAARLADYARSDGDLRFHLIAADGEIDFTEANLDLAVIWSNSSNGHEGVKLAEGAMVEVGTGGHIAWPGDPAEPGSAALTVADAGLALDAALAGLGRAKVPALLANHDGGEPSAMAYWLVAPTPQWRQKKVRAMVAALTA